MQPQQGRQQALQDTGVPAQQLAALQSLAGYGGGGIGNSYSQPSQSAYAQYALAQNPQLQAQIAQAQRSNPQQVQSSIARSHPVQQQQQQQQQLQRQQQQQQQWQATQPGQQLPRPTPRPPTGVPARVAPKAGPLPISGQQQVVSKPAGVPTPAAVRAAEASAATRRYKKRKATDKHMPEQVAQLVPESALYSSLLAMDKQLDGMIATKRACIREALQRPHRLPKQLHVVIHSSHANQAAPRFTSGANEPPRDPPSWELLISGRILDTSAARSTGPSKGTSVPGTVMGTAAPGEGTPLMQHIRRLRVQLDEEQYPGPQGTLDWDRSRNSGDFKRRLEIRRQGSRDVPINISIELEHQPEQWELSEKLQSLVGRPRATKSSVWQSLWAHVAKHNLQSTSDPSLISCDPLLKALFGGSEPMLKLSSFSTRINSHMFALKPTLVNHTVRVSGPPSEDKVVFDLDLPAAPMSERAAAFLEAINKQTQIDQVDGRIASLVCKADDHRRRRSFFLAFSQSPVDFTNALIASQGRDLYAASREGIPDFEALRRTDLFKGKWVEDAVLRYLHKNIANTN